MSEPSAVTNLPEELRQAQHAIELPEVQEMLRKLAEFNLGIFMPHMHDEETGRFQPLPEDVTQVEDSLRVSFHASSELVDEGSLTYLPVGWTWRGAPQAQVRCSISCVVREGTHYESHKSNPAEEGEQPEPGQK